MIIHQDIYVELGILLIIGMVYFILNLPFLNLTCHQDAGWHSYWAAFRDKGVTLKQQHNILMGCSRIGSMALYRLWFYLLGKGDPEKIAIRMFLVFNFIAATILFFTVRSHTNENIGIVFAVSCAYLIISSNPFFGVHYETSERMQGLFNTIIFASICNYLLSPNVYLLFSIVFMMFLQSLLFKIVQLVEYFGLWIAMVWGGVDLAILTSSAFGASVAILIFGLILWRLDLLKMDNLGIIGYVTGSYGHLNSKQNLSLEDKFNKIDSLDLPRRLIEQMKWILKKAQFYFPRRIFLFFFRISEFLYIFLLRLPLFGGKIFYSSRAMISLIICCVILDPVNAILETTSLIWFVSVLIGIIFQNRFLWFHFIPIILPTSVLVGLGFNKMVMIQTSEWYFNPLLLIFIFLLIFDIKFIFNRLLINRNREFDFCLWPCELHPLVEKNFAAQLAADIIASTTDVNDYILTWGTVPQLYVLSMRRSPVNWLNTNNQLMDGILTDWKEKLFSSMKENKPVCIVQFDDDLDLKHVKVATSLEYVLDKQYPNPAFKLYRLKIQ